MKKHRALIDIFNLSAELNIDLANIVQQLPVGIAFYKTGDNSIVFMNDRFCEISGWPQKLFTDLDTLILKVFPDQFQRDAAFATIRHTADRGAWQTSGTKLRIVTQAGKTRFVSIKSIPLHTRSLMMLTLNDVSVESLKSQELESAKNDLKKIIDSSMDMIFAIDENDIIRSVNARSETILGYAPEEMIGKPLFSFINPPEKERNQQIASAVNAGRKVTNIENHYVHKNGSLVPLLWSAVADKTEKIRYGIARDATDIKKSKAALVESERLYRYIFEHNPLPIYIWDFKTLRFLDCNEEALLKYGYSKEEFLQLKVLDIYAAEDMLLIKKAIRSEKTYRNGNQRVWRHKKKNGEMMYVSIRGQLIDYNGRRASLVLANDITERRYYNELDSLEKKVLEMAAENKTPLREILNNYLSGIEALHTGMLCSIMERRYDKLFCLAAPSLPEEVCNSTDGILVSDNTGPGGTVTFLKEKIIISDLESDPRCEALRKAAADHQIKTCWSYPILDSENGLMGTLAMYYREKKSPSVQEENTIQRAMNHLRIILESYRRQQELKLTNERFEYVAEATFDVIWDWNLETNAVYYSNNIRKLFGHKPGINNDNLPFYFEHVHPEDRERVVLYPDQVKYGTMVHWTEEYRFRKADGSYAHVLDKAIVIRDEQGLGKRMIGAIQDITTIKKQHEQLAEIAFINAHEIRRPVASLLGLMQLFKSAKDPCSDPELLDHFEAAIKELDTVIIQIINKTAE